MNEREKKLQFKYKQKQEKNIATNFFSLSLSLSYVWSECFDENSYDEKKVTTTIQKIRYMNPFMEQSYG